MELSRLKFVGFWDRNKREKRKSLYTSRIYVLFWWNFTGDSGENSLVHPICNVLRKLLWLSVRVGLLLSYSRKKKKQGAWGFGIPSCIKEIASGVSRG